MRCSTLKLLSPATLLACSVALLGCDVNVSVGPDEASEEPAAEQSGGEGFSLEIPAIGVDVKGKDGKWDVKAPGTDVKVDGSGTKVRAPGTEVDVDMSTGETKVRAPGTSVDVK